MDRPVLLKVAYGLVALLFLFGVAIVPLSLVDDEGISTGWAAVPMVGSILMYLGLRWGETQPRLAIPLLVVGGIPIMVTGVWAVAPSVAALAVMVYGVRRAWRFDRRRMRPASGYGAAAGGGR